MDPPSSSNNPTLVQASEAQASPIAASSTPADATEPPPSVGTTENGDKASVVTSTGSNVVAESKDPLPEGGGTIIDTASRIVTDNSVVPVPASPATGATRTPPLRRVAAKTLLSRRNGIDKQGTKRRKLAVATSTTGAPGGAAPSGNAPGGGITVTVMNVPQNQNPPTAAMFGAQYMNMLAQQQQMILFQQQQQIVHLVQQQYWRLNRGMTPNMPPGAGQLPLPGGQLMPYLATQQAAAVRAAAAGASTAGSARASARSEKKSPKRAVSVRVSEDISAIDTSTKHAKEVWSGLPEENLEGGWPEGWIKKTFERLTGKTAGTKDSYWYSPITKFRLRSMAEVKKFLNLLAQCHGDESLARQQFKVREPKKNERGRSAITG
jgi:hypothetical protein